MPIRKRVPCSDEKKKKISDSCKGKIPWNKGKTDIYSERTLKSNSDKHKGKPSWNKGKKLSPEHCKALSDAHIGQEVVHSPETCAKISKWRIEHRDLISGPNASGWKGGKSFERYCPKFNEEFREYIRNKFNRTCFICGKPESENIAGPNNRLYRLAVHHVDYDKVDICNGRSWPFIPICNACHAKTNSSRWYWFSKYMNYWIYDYINFTNNWILI